MKTIVVTSQKGGSGKTILVAHLAVEAERSGDGDAWLIDTDKQATLSAWHERRKADRPQRAAVALPQIMTGLAKLAGDHQATFCFVDTAPTISNETARLIDFADLVLIPVRPSPFDLWAVAETVELVKDAAKPFLFVLTQAKPHATITAQAAAALSQHGRVAQAFISDRVAYAAAMTSGNTAPELQPRGPAADEILKLWLEVKTVLHESMQATEAKAIGRKRADG